MKFKIKYNIYFSDAPDWKNASFKNDSILISVIFDSPSIYGGYE